MADDVSPGTEKAPLTGARTLHDVVRHLLAHGPARNDAERDELEAAVNAADPDWTEPEHVMTAEEKAAEWDRLQAQQREPAPLYQRGEPEPAFLQQEPPSGEAPAGKENG